jgi:AraC-like DNA-binding protein
MPTKTLTGKMQRAVELLYYDQLTDEQIAQDLGISRRGLTRWKKQPEFQNALGEFAALQRQKAKELLEATVTKAATTLRDLLDSKNENIRLKASLEVLKLTGTVAEPSATSLTQVEVQISNFFQQLQGDKSVVVQS